MRTLSSRLLASAAAVGLLAGCATHPDASRITFTESLRTNYQLSDHEVRSLQYYVSEDITLRRVVSSGNRRVGDGILIEQRGRVQDIINIKAGTPGVAVGNGMDWVAVSFEPGSYLYFSSRADGVHVIPDPTRGDAPYYLWATDWINGPGVVYVNGVPYEAQPTSAYAHLLVDRKAVARQRSSERVQKGRTLHRRD